MNPRTQSILDRADRALRMRDAEFGGREYRVLVEEMAEEIRALDAERVGLEAGLLQTTTMRDAAEARLRQEQRGTMGVLRDLRRGLAPAMELLEALEDSAYEDSTAEQKGADPSLAVASSSGDSPGATPSGPAPSGGSATPAADAGVRDGLRCNPCGAIVPVDEAMRECPTCGDRTGTWERPDKIPTAERQGAAPGGAVSGPCEGKSEGREPSDPAPGVSASPEAGPEAGPLLDGAVIPSDGEDAEDAPFVCPGCYAVGDERCADYCPDAEMEREREERALYSDLDEEDEDLDEADGRTP